MVKTFKFDAIGRDLYPGERQAAQEFTRKYKSPPTKALTHMRMETVTGRVLRAAAPLNANVTAIASTTRRGSKVQTSTKSFAASVFAGMKPVQPAKKSLAAAASSGMKPVLTTKKSLAASVLAGMKPVQPAKKSLAASALSGMKAVQPNKKSLAASALAGMKPVKGSTKG